MVTLRRAGWRDAVRLYRWRTHPSTAKWMRQDPPRSFVEHVRWLRRVLADKESLLFVAHCDGHPAGTCRLDRWMSDRRIADVSITIEPEARGRGFGTQAIEELVEAGRRVGVRRFVAEVADGNWASSTAFRRAGFVNVYARGQGYWRLEREVEA